MVKFFKEKIKNNFEIFALIIIIIITVSSTTYYNLKKNNEFKAYNNFIDNVYLQKTLNHIIENLEPKYKKIKHKIVSGETFDKILEGYLIDKDEIIKIKTSLNKKVNLNKLNTKQQIQFSIDKTNNKIEEFVYQISNTQKIYLKINLLNDNFDNEILSRKLNKKLFIKKI